MRSKRYPDKPRIGIRARVKFLWGGRVLLGKVTGMCEGGYLVSPVRQRVQMLVKASRVVLSTEGTPLSWIIAQ